MTQRALRPLSPATQLLLMLRDRDGARLEHIAADFPGGGISITRASIMLNCARGVGHVELRHGDSAFVLTDAGRRAVGSILAARELWHARRRARAELAAALINSM